MPLKPAISGCQKKDAFSQRDAVLSMTRTVTVAWDGGALSAGGAVGAAMNPFVCNAIPVDRYSLISLQIKTP